MHSARNNARTDTSDHHPLKGPGVLANGLTDIKTWELKRLFIVNWIWIHQSFLSVLTGKNLNG